MGLYFAPAFSGPDLVRFFWLLAAVNWAVAAVLVLAAWPSLRREPHTETGQAVTWTAITPSIAATAMYTMI